MSTVFPSPCGEKVGINEEGRFVMQLLEPVVSVPLRGKGRDQRRSSIAGMCVTR